MLEQWCFLPDVLKRLSRHYTALDGRYASDWLRGHPGAEATPPETIPDALIDECLGLRAKNKIIKILGRL